MEKKEKCHPSNFISHVPKSVILLNIFPNILTLVLFVGIILLFYPQGFIMGNANSNSDVERYRAGYPDLRDEELNQDHTLNLQFYRNEISSRPNGAKIEDMHQSWWNNYDLLEEHHGYIQVIFFSLEE